MFEFCADPATLDDVAWMACYLTTPKHMSLYSSIVVVLVLLALAAPLALAFGFIGAIASRSRLILVSWPGKAYLAAVRGVPDIVFFLFIPLALDQAFEYLRHRILCPDVVEPVRRGNDFVVCTAAKLPLGSDPQWIHEVYGFILALLAFGFVFGAFTGNVMAGAMAAIPRAQVEAGAAYGMTARQILRRIVVPQMWVYALPGLSNLWMILIKATPLLFLLGVEDIVYWARELGGQKTSQYSSYPHPDWRAWYFLALLVFYLMLTWVSEIGFGRLTRRLMAGQAMLDGREAR